jgi:myo-inositol 2-dehydrogenase / D-chiro-inositol 1-dehydrogenase
MIRFGVLGVGRIGKLHSRNIAMSSRAKVVYLADSNSQLAVDFAREIRAKVASVEDIINAKDVDAILIATPSSTHVELIDKASNAGKAIMCEKPMAFSVEDIFSCLNTIERNQSLLMIGFNRRFDPYFAALRKRIQDGNIGEVEIVTISSRDPSPPTVDYLNASGGLYCDMMIHDFDMARFLINEEFVTVHAMGSSLIDERIAKAGDIDTACVHMQTESGKLSVITNSRRAVYGYDQRIEVHGSKGMLRADNVYNTTLEIANANGFTRDPILNFFIERYNQSYINELHAFMDAVSFGKRHVPNGYDGLMAQKLANAATKSWQTGKMIKVL